MSVEWLSAIGYALRPERLIPSAHRNALSRLLILFTATLLISLAGTTHAASLVLAIRHTFAGEPLQLDSVRYRNAAGESLSVTRLSYFLSGFALQRQDETWLELPEQTEWLDAARRRTVVRLDGVPAGTYRAVRFQAGVPRDANHSDTAKYPADHPLNPNLNGLHWSWQGGYIFMAIEGLWHPASKKTSALNGYSLHFANDWNLTRIAMPAALDLSRDSTLSCDLDVAELLRNIAFAKEGTSTHSRGGDPISAKIAKALPGAFRIGANQRDQPKVVAVTTRLQPTRPLYLPEKFTPYRFTISRYFPVPDLPKDNPLTEERVALGRALFHEPKLSRDNSISCASCHDQYVAFSDARRYSPGVEGRLGTRHVMPLFNLAWKNTFFWDGRAPSLRAQALMPIQDHTEMDESLERVVRKLSSGSYPEQFIAAFGSADITPEKIGLAIESFVLTLTSFDSKFDRSMRGDAGVSLTDQEKRGFELFFTEYDPRRGQFGADCFHCHGGANFADHGFANNGLDATFADPGRFTVTKRESDRGKFSVPSLRNVAVTAPYMHDGRIATLEEVLAHYTSGVRRSPTLDPNLAKHPDGGVPMSAEDKAALLAFLKTLTDERFLPPAPVAPPKR